MADSPCSLPSSPLSSLGSRSPSPPVDYPSPATSNVSEGGSSQSQSRRRPAEEAPTSDGSPPAKKPRVMKPKEPKELKTEYLDLGNFGDTLDEAEQRSEDAKLKKLMDMLRLKKKIVVVAGAGISVSAGIPDFRSSTGLFNTLRSQHKLKASGKHLFDASVYRSDSSTSSFHDMVRELSHMTQKAKPTPFHHMIATIAKEGRLMRLYTQNVDGIESALEPLTTTVPLDKKGPWPKTIQLHGGLSKMVCSKCGHLSDFNSALFEGPEPPSCGECEATDIARVAGGLRSHGIGRLRPRMVLYNEFNPDEDAIGAVSHADLKSRPDAVLVVGTSLKVPGIRRLVKELCAVTRGRRGGCTAWVNFDPEPVGIDVKDCWDLVVRGESDELARYAGLPHWDDKECGPYKLIQPDEAKEIKSEYEVIIKSKALDVVKKEGIITPGASPRQQSPSRAVGAAKPKQSQLPFGSKKPVEKPLKAKKKPGRKPLPAGPADKITLTFGSTKITKTTAKQSTETKTDDVQSAKSTTDMLALFPNLYSAPSKPSTDSTLSTGAGAPRPQTPTTPTGQGSPTYAETISPKGGVPHNMANLLS